MFYFTESDTNENSGTSSQKNAQSELVSGGQKQSELVCGGQKQSELHVASQGAAPVSHDLLTSLAARHDEKEMIMKLFITNLEDSRLKLFNFVKYSYCQLLFISLMDYKCKLCSFVCDWPDMCITHMKEEHPGWQKETGGMHTFCPLSVKYFFSQILESLQIVNFDDAFLSAPATSSQAQPVSPLSRSNLGTPHNQQEWLDFLKRDYIPLVVQKCSEETKSAVENDDDIKVRIPQCLDKIIHF